MKKILVPTDFSPNAARAIDYAVQIAKRNGAMVHLVNACDSMEYSALEGGLPASDFNKRMTEDSLQNLDALQKSISEAEKINVNTSLYSGKVPDSILTACEDESPDLVIMGTMGITSIKDKLFGTNTAAVMGRTKVPLLSIPLEYVWERPAKFLLAINNFNEVNEVLSPVFDLAGVFGAEVKVVVFSDDNDADAVTFMADEKAVLKAEETLKKLFPTTIISADHLSGFYFEESITAYIEKHKIDVLAMTTHKRTFLGSIFNRSMTKRMSYHAQVPLLAIPV